MKRPYSDSSQGIKLTLDKYSFLYMILQQCIQTKNVSTIKTFTCKLNTNSKKGGNKNNHKRDDTRLGKIP